MADDIITLGHGSGGILGHELVSRLFLKHFSDPLLGGLEDASLIGLDDG
ncbi:MAG TPA: hydrogenase expression/formation protein HypE, partial [Chloroflexi bacterium]|nr:hydrogenase expression/formation protein HypE [Chloroflexota bacterium]